MRKQKSIKIYSELPDSERKKWYSDKQVLVGFGKYFFKRADLNELDRHKSVRKTHLLVQSTEYRYHLKNNTGEFYGVKYDCKIFYNYEDITKLLDEDFFEQHDFTLDRIENKEQLTDLRTWLNDRRSIQEENVLKPVVFYGDKQEALVHTDYSSTFRAYYGLFFNRPYIDYMFCKAYKIRQILIDGLVYLFVYKFFTMAEFYGFARSRSYFGMSGGAFFNLMEKEGYIKKVKYKDSSMYKKTIKNRSKQELWTTTEKCDKLVSLYMDYVLYKRKLYFDGVSYSDVEVSIYDVVNRGANKGRKTSTHYVLYSSMYDWINYTADIKLTDDDVVAHCKKMTSSSFFCNPYIWQLAEKDLLKTGGEKMNRSYINKFLNNDRWGSGV